MPIYIEETRRGYPDPVDWDTANIELHGQGKGSYLFGKDEVFYIGDPENVVISNTAERSKVFRMYDGRAIDHLYTIDPEEKPRSFNREPRTTEEYVFTVLKSQASGSVPLYRHYKSAGQDHKYSLSSTVSGYTLESIMGYVFTSYSAAQIYANTKIGEVASPVYSYYSASGVDSFLTLYPNNEVNLQEYNSGPLGPPYPGDDNQTPDRGDDYVYQGILCWTFSRVSNTDTRRIIEIGKPQYAGSAFTWGWLTDVNGGTSVNSATNWAYGRYSLIASRNFLINDQRANFTFLYGEFGPVKAALPRFLGYKYLYDSQFFYYLYDTSDPWNGPCFGVRLQTELNSIYGCWPIGQTGGLTHDYKINRYYYHLRPNVWKTKKTKIYTDVKSDSKEDQNIFTAGTDDKIVFFRYTAGSFNMVEGDTVNGWRITEHRYMGDELTTGFIRLSPATSGTLGNTFTYGNTYSSSNTSYPASFVALAGYGIANKAAVFGVYEFKKKVWYYKVELYPKAAIPKRTMDVADMEAVIDNNGKISDIIIHNGGYGYSTSARVEVMAPPIENTSADVENTRNYYVDSDIADTSATTDKIEWSSSLDYRSIGENTIEQLKDGVILKETSVQLKPAEVEISSMSNEGCIQSVRILKYGSGYDPQSPPPILVYDPNKINYEESPRKSSEPDLLASSKNSKGALLDTLSTIGKGQTGSNMDSGGVNDILSKSFKNTSLTSSIDEAFAKFDDGVSGDVYTGYIKGVAELDPDSKFEFCLGVPGTCSQPVFSFWDPFTSFNDDWFKNIVNYDTSGEFTRNYNFLKKEGSKVIATGERTANESGGMYGVINKNGTLSPSCIKMDQPKLLNVNHFYDIPCPYTEGTGDNQKVFGYLPYQYSPSKEESITFNIYMEVDGDFTGSASSTAQNNAFITKLKGLQAPKILAPRPAAEGVKTWQCSRGSYEGRCFRAGDGDISFYPIGADENVYDYTHLSVYDAQYVWIGQNSSSITGTAGTGGGRYYYWLGGGAAGPTFKYIGPAQPTTSWDYYVYDAATNPNGLFFKYTGYDGDGNGTGLLSRWDNYIYTMSACVGIYDIDSMIAFDPTQIQYNNDLVRLGPMKGTITVKNYSIGSAQVYAKAFNYFGNPYFESCLNATN